LQVKCYCDAGFETDRDDTKSQTRYIFTLNGGAVVWKSSKQSTTTQHATEAEYIAAVEAAKEAVWIKNSNSVKLRFTINPNSVKAESVVFGFHDKGFTFFLVWDMYWISLDDNMVNVVEEQKQFATWCRNAQVLKFFELSSKFAYVKKKQLRDCGVLC
nr:retrotransposon protein, putative, Ty1-copia subclass [Tanacetum cinerariifolium]